MVELHRAVSAEFGGRDAAPGVVESQFGLVSAIQRPQATVFGRDAFTAFSDKAAAFIFALLQNMPFQNGNRRLAVAALVAFCELNGRTIEGRAIDEKTLEGLIKRAAGHRELGIPPENVFAEMRDLFAKSIVLHSPA
jgi:prophage maintenance system killer protein